MRIFKSESNKKKNESFICKEPVVIDCLMQIVCAQWNHDGSVLAIGGVQVNDDKESNLVQFFNPWGTVTKRFFGQKNFLN